MNDITKRSIYSLVRDGEIRKDGRREEGGKGVVDDDDDDDVVVLDEK